MLNKKNVNYHSAASQITKLMKQMQKFIKVLSPKTILNEFISDKNDLMYLFRISISQNTKRDYFQMAKRSEKFHEINSSQ